MKRFLFLLAMCLIALSCATRKTPPGTLVIVVDNYPKTFDPRMGIDLASQRVFQLCYNGLFVRDMRDNLQKDLLEDYLFEDGRVFYFTLKKGVYFHNGEELTVDDVFYTLKTTIEQQSLKSGPFLEIGKMEKLSRYKGKIVLSKKDPSFLINLCDGAFGVVSRKDGKSGTGAYVIEKRLRGREIVLSAFDNYFKGAPVCKRIVLKTVKDATTRTFEMLNGSADIVFDGISYENLKLFKGEKFRILRNVSNSVDYITFNFRHPIFSDKRVREAVCLALDRESAVKYIFYGYARPATSLLAPGNFFHFNRPQCDYSVSLANKLLDEAGYEKDENGVRFKVDFLSTNSFISRLKALFVQDSLRKIGIEVNINSMDFGAFFDLISKRKFAFYSARWIGLSDPDIYRMLFYSKMTPPKGWNRGYYFNPETDRLIEKASETSNLEKRRKIYEKINDIVLNDYAYILLWHPENVVIASSKIKNLKITPSKSFSYLYLVSKER